MIELQNLSKTFQSNGKEVKAVDSVSLTVNEGEICVFLGPSGCGKSTTLKMINRLIMPTSGKVLINGEDTTGLDEVTLRRNIGYVIQQIGLFPNMTIEENIVVVPKLLGWDKQRCHDRARELMSMIKLEPKQYLHRYPRELSGGQQQRIGVIRALAADAPLLLMDEPFSALDVLTAETLRTDLLDMWSEGRMPIKSILMVTHNIAEAVLMCDRILLFSSNPGRVISEIKVDLPQPRNRQDPIFRALVEEIYVLMTQDNDAGEIRQGVFPGTGLGMVLPQVSTNALAGLIEAIHAPPYSLKADLPELAAALHYNADELFPIAEVLQLLRFAELKGGDIRLLPAANRYALADVDERKQLFAQHLLSFVPLVAHIRRVLDDRPTHTAPARRFRDQLEDFMSESDAMQTLNAVIQWGRYAELFAYDELADQFSLDNPS
ncbi:ABC transporter [Pseudomonas syringae pv. aptata]|uniref:ABC transporter n=5 Tax=Pseudomonas syringae TaxID=317 RepID=A0A3M3X6A4_PSEAP|nr:AAA-associated domain-containing protein [Pseudomonas syringae]RMO65558.1 ABC transporter [Pseudomonas syringae pv. aptata]